MRERPILFSAPMVRAILEGRKSQTRRALSDRYVHGDQLHTPSAVQASASREGRWFFCARKSGHIYSFDCTYGKPGDRLWVRETWGVSDQGFDTAEESTFVVYRADDERAEPKRWRSPIHMPRWASRITLEVTDVRVERLQAISEADALAEGVDPAGPVGYIPASDRMGRCRYQYANLWESINGAGSWDANPFVWVVSFKRIEA